MSESKETKYAFWIELTDGQEVRWSNLSKRKVIELHSMTEKRIPLNIKAFGWEEQK